MKADILRELGALDYPMVIVTVRNETERSGSLVGFQTQCSIDPCRWFVCLSKRNHTFGVAQEAQTLIVHLLRADQRPLAVLFGAETGDMVDKFARCGWRDGPGGAPILDGCDWVAGHIIGRVDLGDHEGQLLEVIEAGQGHVPQSQLRFEDVRGMKPGHDP